MLIIIIDCESFVLLSMLVFFCLADDMMKVVENFLLVLWAALKMMGMNEFRGRPEKHLLECVMSGEGIVQSLHLKEYCSADAVERHSF